MKELLYLKDEQLKGFVEKLFMGYRETFSDAKKVLDKHSIGIAHHKVIHLLSIYEGITVSDLLKKLKVTKQSLNIILKDLIKLDVISFENFPGGGLLLRKLALGACDRELELARKPAEG